MPRPDAPRRVNRHLWLLDPLLDMPGCVVRSMFGCKSCYVNGLLVLVLADGDEPWRGVLVPTERAVQAELMRAFPVLSPHPVLPKWLYLPEAAPSFERDAQAIVERIRRLDPLIGVLPDPKKRKKRPSAAATERPLSPPAKPPRRRRPDDVF